MASPTELCITSKINSKEQVLQISGINSGRSLIEILVCELLNLSPFVFSEGTVDIVGNTVTLTSTSSETPAQAVLLDNTNIITIEGFRIWDELIIESPPSPIESPYSIIGFGYVDFFAMGGMVVALMLDIGTGEAQWNNLLTEATIGDPFTPTYPFYSHLEFDARTGEPTYGDIYLRDNQELTVDLLISNIPTLGELDLSPALFLNTPPTIGATATARSLDLHFAQNSLFP